jgi:hypothetical protein
MSPGGRLAGDAPFGRQAEPEHEQNTRTRESCDLISKLDSEPGRGHHVVLLRPNALLRVGLSPAAKVLDLKGAVPVSRAQGGENW